MPNSLTATGLTTATQAELVAAYTLAWQTIYGPDIDLSPSSPDGQRMLIEIQSALDNEDLITQVYNTFDPDNAIGVTLDWRVAINGIQRQAGTFTVTNITLVATQAATLQGLNQTNFPVYTVADSSGNQWELISTQVISGAGTYVFAFQSATPGANVSIPNTITVPVTIVLGITSINNPTTYTTLGINEESDAALRLRRQKSVALSSQSFYSSMIAALENINGITSAFVYENDTDSTDGDGVPGHSIWVIVAGTASNADIANAIYTKRSTGAGMFGLVVYDIVRPDGTSFPINWDVVTPEDLFIEFTATSLDGINPPNIAAIRAGLVANFVPGVFQEVNINALATAVQAIDPNTLVTDAGFSIASGGPFTNTLLPTTKKNQFVVSAPNIIITPMILSPVTSTVAPGGTIQFTALGGFGTLTFSITSAGSGSPSVSGSGFYTAGAGAGTDQVKVLDSLGNAAFATVTVT